MDEKLAIGVIVIAVVMLVITVVGSSIEPKPESEKRITFKKENSWIWEIEKKNKSFEILETVETRVKHAIVRNCTDMFSWNHFSFTLN